MVNLDAFTIQFLIFKLLLTSTISYEEIMWTAKWPSGFFKWIVPCVWQKMMYNYNHTWYLSLTAWVKKFPTGHKVSPQVKHHKPSLFTILTSLNIFTSLNISTSLAILIFWLITSFWKYSSLVGWGGIPSFRKWNSLCFSLFHRTVKIDSEWH